jgi:hypothetical protein
MRISVAALLAAVLVSIAFAAGCAGNDESGKDAKEKQATTNQDAQRTSEETTEGRSKARSEEVALEMNGEEGTGFSGTCTAGDEETEIDGEAPETFNFPADERLECEISADDAMEIVFTNGKGTRSVQRIGEGTLNLTYENGSISSFSTSSSGGGYVNSSQVVSSAQNSSSSVSISP